MTSLNTIAFLSAAALAAALSVGLGWLTGKWFEPDAWLVRALLVSGACSAAVAAAGLFVYRILAGQKSLVRYLEQLRRFDDRDASPGLASDALPQLPADHPWGQTLAGLRETMTTIARRLQEAEHARASLELRAKRHAAEAERMKQVLDAIQEPVIAVNPYNELTLANPCATKLLAIDATSTERRVLSQLVRCDKLLDLMADTRRRRGTAARSEDIEFESADGRPQAFRVTAARLGGEAAESNDNVVAVLRDVADQKAEQKRYAEFVSAVSHEMKTPLAGIKAYVELLADGEATDAETREEFLNVINTQADRLHRLIDNMLNLARIEAGVTKVSKDTRSLNDLLEESLHVIRPAAERKQITLRSELSPLYLNVFVDRDTMLQAAINLLSNAVKYTPDGGTVTLRSRLDDGEALFEVEDTGVGLSPEDCSNVFQKFYRVKQHAEMAAGTGLGLPLVKHIIEDIHGGRIEVASELGRGSTFRVALPSSNNLV